MTRRAWTDLLAARHVQPPLFEALPAQPKRRKPGTVRRVEPREVELQKLILAALRLHPKVARIERTNTGAGRFLRRDGTAGRFVRFGFAGQSDLSGMSKCGRVIAIEIKRRSTRNDVSEHQRAYLDQVRAAGGFAGVACSVEDAYEILEGLA
jgi:hypothetical protein